MDTPYPISYQLHLATAQVSLLAGQMLNVTDPREVEHDALALVLQDIARRLDLLGRASEHCGNCPFANGEGRP